MYLYFHFPNILYNIHNLFGDNTLTDEVFRSYFSLMRRSKEKKNTGLNAVCQICSSILTNVFLHVQNL